MIPPYLGGAFVLFQNMETEISPHRLWMVCGQVMQIPSTGGKGLGGMNLPNIRGEAGFVIPDVAVGRFYPQFPQPLRLILNHESYLINA
jgi:hypothetical protein